MSTYAILSLTANGTAFNLDTNKVVMAYDNASTLSVLTFENAYGVNETVTLTISTSALVALSTNILFSTTILEASGQTKVVAFNNARVLKLSANIANASHTDMWYFTNTNEVPQTFVSTSSDSSLSTAVKVTIPVTNSGNNAVYYINSQRVGNITTTTDAGQVLSSTTVVAAGTTMIPNSTILTLVDDGSTVKSSTATVKVATTKVVSATVYAGGTTVHADGNVTVTGTTGTGTPFTALVTIATGTVSAVVSITTGGSYTANPTSLTVEPVTFTGLTGCQLTVVMGANTVTPLALGGYSKVPANPIATTGGNNGCTLTATWGEGSISGAKITYNDTNEAVYAQLLVEETPSEIATLINAL